MIATRDFTQSYFPAEIDTELAPIPDDELPALVEEALALPPIDLTVAPTLLESTAVLVLAPVPRSQWRAVITLLQQTATDPQTRQLVPAAANRLAARKPLEILQRLRLPVPLPLPVDTSDPREREWARLAALPNLWFVRRRNLAYRDDLPGVAVRFAGRNVALEDVVRRRLGATGLRPQFDAVMDKATPGVAAEVSALLDSPRFATSPVLTAAALGELTRIEALDRAAVLAASARLSLPGTGDGLLRLERSQGELLSSPEALAKIADTADWRDTDVAARAASDAAVPDLAGALAGRPAVTEAAAPASGEAAAPAKKKRARRRKHARKSVER